MLKGELEMYALHVETRFLLQSVVSTRAEVEGLHPEKPAVHLFLKRVRFGW